MGGSSSKPTVLECMLKHFKKGFSGIYGIKMSPGRLCTLCELEWPTFGVPTIRAIYQVVIGASGHANQFPHINSWLQVSQTMPPWVKFCTNKKRQSRVFMAQAMKPKYQKPTKPVLQGDPEDEPPIPPMYIPRAPPPSVQQVTLLPDSTPPSVSLPQPRQQSPSPNEVPQPSPA
jgi:hypothetical protein